MTEAIVETLTRNARLSAVQCAYAAGFLGERPTRGTLGRFLERSFASDDDGKGGAPARLDAKLFAYLVRGISREQGALDSVLARHLRVAIDRSDRLLMALLRAGAFELMFRKNAPAAAVVAEYTRLAGEFFSISKVALVNAVLDKVAKTP